MDAILLFRESDISFISQKADDALKLKGVAELLDGPVISGSLKIANTIVSPKITDSIKETFHSAMDEIVAGDFDGASEVLADFLNSQIDVPMLNEEAEGMILRGVLSSIVGLLKL